MKGIAVNFKKALKMFTPYGLVLFFQKCKIISLIEIVLCLNGLLNEAMKHTGLIIPF